MVWAAAWEGSSAARPKGGLRDVDVARQRGVDDGDDDAALDDPKVSADAGCRSLDRGHRDFWGTFLDDLASGDYTTEELIAGQ